MTDGPIMDAYGEGPPEKFYPRELIYMALLDLPDRLRRVSTCTAYDHELLRWAAEDVLKVLDAEG